MIKMNQASKMGDGASYREAVGSLAMTSASVSIGQLIGTQAASAAFAAAGIIDYSLDQLKKQQVSGIQDKYYKAYQAYYSTSGSHYRSLPKWFNLLYEGALTRTPDEWDKWVKDEIDVYVNKFWKDTSGDAEILLNEYGINHGSDFAERTVTVSAESKYLLLRQFNECNMWQRIADKVMAEMVSRTDQKHLEMERILNKKVWLQYQTGKISGDKTAVIISGDGGDWISTPLTSDGKIDVYFTVWAYTLANSPVRVEVRNAKNEVCYSAELPQLNPNSATPDVIVLPDLNDDNSALWGSYPALTWYAAITYVSADKSMCTYSITVTGLPTGTKTSWPQILAENTLNCFIYEIEYSYKSSTYSCVEYSDNDKSWYWGLSQMPYGGSATIKIYMGQRGPNIDDSGSSVKGVAKGRLLGEYKTGNVTWEQADGE